ncbi:MAG: hypothetical protein PHS44_00145 [Candidatus Dojkabacteria bacterium]|nr:hypothetical protein [Candidatus Dojkabacteria bacterium]
MLEPQIDQTNYSPERKLKIENLAIFVALSVIIIILFLLLREPATNFVESIVENEPSKEDQPESAVSSSKTIAEYIGELKEGNAITLTPTINVLGNVINEEVTINDLPDTGEDDPWVNVIGDTMTGDLTITGGANLILTDSEDLVFSNVSLKSSLSRQNSGAFFVGTFDEYVNSDSTNVQDVMDDLDEAIGSLQNRVVYWNEAYSWGDHSIVGYLTEESEETDPVWTEAESSYFNISENELITGWPNFAGGQSGIRAPFRVDSTFLVTNLNADLLDGYHASDFMGEGVDLWVDETGDTMSGILNMGGYRIENIAVPNSNDDAIDFGSAESNYINDGAGEINAVGDFNFAATTNITNLSADYLDSQDSSYYRNVSNINAGTLGSAYFSAYSDLNAEGYVPASSTTIWTNTNDGAGSGLDADLLDAQTGTYYTNASNINSGTLGTAYYSAYADLTAENYLNNDAGTDLLTQTQLDGRYINNTGDTMTTAGLPFSGITTDIYTPSGEALTLSAPGAQDINLYTGSGVIGIGTTTSLVEVSNVSTAYSDHKDLLIRSTGTNQATYFRVAPNGTPPDSIIWSTVQVFATDWSADQSNVEAVEMRFNRDADGAPGNQSIFQINTYAGGTGTLHPLAITVDDEAYKGIFIDTGANVGIGSTSPAQELDVEGDIQLDANESATTNGLCHSGANSDTTFTDRNIVACSSTPGDIAEWYDTKDAEAGDIVYTTGEKITYISPAVNAETGEVLNQNEKLTASILAKSNRPYQANILGVVSTSPYESFGKAINKYSSNPNPIALTGRVPVKVVTYNGAIKPGDPITASSIAGVGMKSTKPGHIIGIALDHYDSINPYKVGKILVSINLSWYEPESYLKKVNETIQAYDMLSTQGQIDILPDLNITDTLTAKNASILSIQVKDITVQNNLEVSGVLTSRSIKADTIESAFSKSIIIKLSDHLGNTAFEVQNDQSEKVFSIDSNGKIYILSDSSNTSVGSTVLSPGNEEIRVETKAVTSDSKIFISPISTSSIPPNVWIKEKGIGFFIIRQEEVSDQNLVVDWWVIN